LLAMLSTVNFYHYPFFQTYKIDKIRPDGPLSAKLVSANLAWTKMTPKQAFRVRRLASELSRSGL
jgi:hypothetical protein